MGNEMKIPEWVLLNNQVVDENLHIKDTYKDKLAIKSYLKNEIKPKLLWFDTVEEKIEWLVTNNYWENEMFTWYTKKQIHDLFEYAYSFDFRFNSYMSAFKFYNDYSLRTNDKKNYLETYEDRMVINAIYHSNGNYELAKRMIKSLINQDFTPSTPTVLNTGRSRRGEFTSCFLLTINDSLNDISRNIEFGMQLSIREH